MTQIGGKIFGIKRLNNFARSSPSLWVNPKRAEKELPL